MLLYASNTSEVNRVGEGFRERWVGGEVGYF